MKFIKHKFFVFFIWALVIVFGSISLKQGVVNALLHSDDFEWSPLKVLVDGKNPYTTFIDGCIDKNQPCDFILNQAPNYPVSGLGFIIYIGFMSFDDAKILWIIINIICSILLPFFSIRILQKEGLKINEDWKIVLFSIFFLWSTLPFRNGLGNGQQALFSITLFMAAYYYSPKNVILASFCLAAGWLKYTITLPLTLILLITQKISPRIFIGAIIISVLEFLFFAWFTKSGIFDIVFGPLKVGVLTTGIGYIDFFSIAKRIFQFNKLIEIVCYSLSGLTIVILCMYSFRNKEQNVALFWGFLSVNTLIFHNIYDFVILIFPAIYLYVDMTSGGPYVRRFGQKGTILLVFIFIQVFFLHRIFTIFEVRFSLFYKYFFIAFALFYYLFITYKLISTSKTKIIYNH